jgi:lipopolysaccharide biosynthesis regulator YciM
VEIDLAWLLVLPMLFALGWATARYDRRQQRGENRGVSRDVLNGLSDVLADDLEGATESLLCAARLAPDATELHRSVGNLYRRRGLIDRAIEVHEGALKHPEISEQDEARLRLDLGRDYLAAGLFDRATTAFETGLAKAVERGAVLDAANQARALLLQTAQRTRDWASAITWAQELHNHGGSFGEHSHPQLMGHFYCEQAEAALRAGKHEEALAALAKAESFSAAGPRKRAAQVRMEISGGSRSDSQSTPTPSSCRVCGFRSRQTHWQCPGCHHWDSFLESKS